MSKVRAKAPQRRGPALLLLLACFGLAAYRLKGHLFDGSLADFATSPGAADDTLMSSMPESQAAAADETEKWVDLLAKYGSCNAGQMVPSVFRFHPASSAEASVPAGEVRTALQEDWRDGDPPQVRIGVVMISESSRRAVIDNHVFGIGEDVAGGRVHRIDRGSVQILWNRRVLTYPLGDGFPVEFRSELQKRAASASGRQDADEQERRDTEKK